MSYPYLPVNPCCTDVVLNSPCGCSSTITNSGCGSNDPCSTHTTLSSNVIYNGPILPCIIAEPCDTLNVILQKIDEIICTLLGQINTLQGQVNNITTELLVINNDITNIYNTLDVCCVITTTTTSTLNPCESFSLNNTGVDPVAVIITDCETQEPEAIVLLPGDTNVCVVTDSPLTVPGTVIVTPNGPCGTSTTTSTSSSTTTSTTTEAIPCECLTFYNEDVDSHIITYVDCNGSTSRPITILSHQTLQYCGCCAEASDPFVTINIGANCISGQCPDPITTTTTSSSTSTTTSTSTSTSTSTTTSTSSTSTTTTSTTCNPATPHPFNITVVNGTNTVPDSNSFLVDACAAVECLQDASCTISSSISTYWNVEYPGIGDIAYAGSTGCTLGLTGYDGYFQISYDGIWVVVQIVNSVIVDFPSCITTTTTTTVVDCINYLVQGLYPSGTWEGFDCNGAPISGTVAGGSTDETGCMNASTLVLSNAYIKDSTPCTTTTTTTAL
jgi:hypothetical protein